MLESTIIVNRYLGVHNRDIEVIVQRIKGCDI